MSDKQQTIASFLEMLNSENCNKVEGDNSYEEVFGPGKPFSVVCNKCGSPDVHVVGERGVDYGGWTGYQEGSTVVKCGPCGNAITVWE